MNCRSISEYSVLVTIIIDAIYYVVQFLPHWDCHASRQCDAHQERSEKEKDQDASSAGRVLQLLHA